MIKVLTAQQQESLLASVQGRLGMRNAMIVRLFLLTGLRVSELVGLVNDDIYLGNEPKKYLFVRSQITKRGFPREIPLSEKLRADLKLYYQDRVYSGRTESVEPGRYLFTQHKNTSAPLTCRQVQRIIKMAGGIIGVPDLHPHTLRHTFATQLMRITGMRTVMALLGHKSIQSTQIYTHPTSDDLVKAVNGL